MPLTPSMIGPDPSSKEPAQGYAQLGYLKNFITRKNILVGDYTYYDDPEGPENFEKNVLYHFDFVGDKLIIGKFCAIATGVKFLMNGGNHSLKGFSTYPFYIFDNGWEQFKPEDEEVSTNKGDTVVDHDVWMGYGATLMPGVHVGSGAIIASKSVVTRDVPPYAVVGGNPAKIIRMRYEEDIIARLLQLAWWDWPAEKITQNLEFIVNGDLDALTEHTSTEA